MVANTALTASIIAREALVVLENSLVMARMVRRDYEKEFNKEVNGYKIGDTASIRRPALYTVRSGATAQVQDSIEGKTSIVIDKQKGVDLEFGSADMTLKISDFSERFLKDPMVKLANQVDLDLFTLYQDVYNWVGTPGELINSWSDFSLAPKRLDNMAVPKNDRYAMMSPDDGYPLSGSFSTNTFASPISKEAIEDAALPRLAGIAPYIAQNVRNHTTGSRVASGASQVDGAGQVSAYTTVKDTYTQSLVIKNGGNTLTIKKGDVFTIAGVNAVNPVSKDDLGFLQQFVVTADATTTAGGAATLTISPPIITSGAYQTVTAAPADSAAIVYMGTASTTYRQNIACQKGAFALAMVPMELPGGAVTKSRQSYKGMSVRLIQVYDGTNDSNFWRLDILYGVKAIDPRLATRLSGTA